MAELDLVRLAVQYGPCVLVIWFAYRDWEREKRMAKALDEGMNKIQEIALKATEAITENTNVLKQMHDEIKTVRDWNGRERRQGGQK